MKAGIKTQQEDPALSWHTLGNDTVLRIKFPDSPLNLNFAVKD